MGMNVKINSSCALKRYIEIPQNNSKNTSKLFKKSAAEPQIRVIKKKMFSVLCSFKWTYLMTRLRFCGLYERLFSILKDIWRNISGGE